MGRVVRTIVPGPRDAVVPTAPRPASPTLTGEAEHFAAASGNKPDLFGTMPNRPPVIVSWGVGVDSTAMIIEMISRGEIIDAVLTAETYSEKSKTYEFRPIFMDWLKSRSVECHIVDYKVKNYKNYPKYYGLFENCMTNGTLPGVSFGLKSCSKKHKQQPQDTWCKSWKPAVDIWNTGGRVIKCIGYDAGKLDSRRHAKAEGMSDDKYLIRTPLREWGWDREACEDRIRAEGLPVPPKSSCYFCVAMKPDEVRELEGWQLARIVAMEARAAPRLGPTTHGLWRHPVQGFRGAVRKPGSMTEFIRQERLLPADAIDRIVEMVPKHLVAFMASVADTPIEERPELKDWLEFFMASPELGLDAVGAPRLYAEARDEIAAAAA